MDKHYAGTWAIAVLSWILCSKLLHEHERGGPGGPGGETTRLSEMIIPTLAQGMLGVCYTFISSRYQGHPEGPEHMVDRDKTKILMLY